AVNAGALVVLLQLAREGSPDLRAACLQCLAVLSKQDAFKRRLLDQGAVEVVCGAASASGEEQRPAAACLANLCSDPHLLSHIAANPATIPALTTLSQSPIKDVQRHAARAFWHLAFAEDSKPRLLEAQGLPAMLRLALPATYSTATQALSRQALRRLADDPQVKDQIFQESPLSAQEMENMLYNSELTPQGSSLHPSDSAGHLSLDRKASGGAYLGSQPGSSIPRNFSAATNPDEPSAARSGSVRPRDLREGSSGATLATTGNQRGYSRGMEQAEDGVGQDRVSQNHVQAEEGGTWSMTSPGAQQASQGLLTSQGSVSKLIAAYSQQPTWKASVPPEMRRTSSRYVARMPHHTEGPIV
ncbi:hypothetical protein WJX84_002457, partial [Apatococcus fuscideae]